MRNRIGLSKGASLMLLGVMALGAASLGAQNQVPANAPPPGVLVSTLAELLKSFPGPAQGTVNIGLCFGGPLSEERIPQLEALSRSLSSSGGGRLVAVCFYDSQGQEAAGQAARQVNSKCTFYEDPRRVFQRMDVDAVVFLGFSSNSKIYGLDLDRLALDTFQCGKDAYVLPATGIWKPVQETIDVATKWRRVAWAGNSNGDDFGSFLHCVRTREQGVGSITRLP